MSKTVKTVKEIKSDIAELKAVLEEASTPKDVKATLKKQLEGAEKELEEAEANEAEAEKAAAEKKKADAEKQQADEKKAQEAAAKKKAVKEKMTADCSHIPSLLRKLASDLEPRIKAKKAAKAKKKRTSTVVADGIAGTVSRVVKKELTREKVGHIKVAKLRDARDKFAGALKDLRSALGGISTENDAFIDSFKKQMNELIEAVESKQKEVATKKAA